MKKFNVNGMIECKLTKHGEQILRDYYSKYDEYSDRMFMHSIRKLPNGNNRFAVWLFGHIFGDSLLDYDEHVVVGDVIYLSDNAFAE